MLKSHRTAIALSWLIITGSAGAAVAGASPMGTWIDHSGEGAVEISDCGGKLCGKVVWLKSAANLETCNLQVIGNAKAAAGGKWDGGWIYDPENKTQYDVELTPVGDKLKVLGYAGVKMFGETMMWTRAPGDLKRCDVKEEAAKPASVAEVPAVQPGSDPVRPSKPVQPSGADLAPVPAPSATTPVTQSAQASVAPPATQQPPATKRPPVAEAKKFSLDDLNFDDIDVRKVKGKCDVTIKELGSFKFDC
ncbi:MAG: DUF2147 domain-containing protein [Hyphomicrobiaceae bacterium]